MSEIDIDLGLKSLTVSLARLIVIEPAFLQLFDAISKEKGYHGDWLELQAALSEPGALARFAENLEEDVDQTEWTQLDEAATKWAEYGWVIGSPMFRYKMLEYIPQSQKDADEEALRHITKKKLEELWLNTLPILPNHRKMFNEACICFTNKCYSACASLLITLIDGTLIRSKANAMHSNRKTGSVAQKRLSNEYLKDDFYRLPGYFHWQLLNFDLFIHGLFKSANNFTDEPSKINRNFLHHGMNKRKVLRKDCIKLFLAYDQALIYCKQ